MPTHSLALHGIIPPMCTPLTEDGEIDAPSVRRLVDHLIDGGVHGIFVLGSSGEFALLTDRQKKLLLHETVSAAQGRVPILAGILDTSTNRCIDNARTAQDAGVDALVLACVYYHRNSQAEIMDHFRAVRAAVDLPLIAYDVPATVNVKLDLKTLKKLHEEGVIDGVKDSSGAVEQFRHLILSMRGTDFRVFTGSELIVDSCLQMGAHGSVPGLGNIFPAEYVQIYNWAMSGEWDKAAQLQERLLVCFWDLISQGDPGYSFSASALGGFKTGLKVKGILASTQLGAPLHSFSPAEEERVAEVMRRHGFL